MGSKNWLGKPDKMLGEVKEGGGDNSGMDLHPIQGLVIILPVASCQETKIN